jgi:hypothetical protein
MRMTSPANASVRESSTCSTPIFFKNARFSALPAVAKISAPVALAMRTAA